MVFDMQPCSRLDWWLFI